MRITGIMTYPDDRVKSIMLLVVYAVMLLYPVTMFIQKEIKTEYFAVLVFLSFYGFLSGRIRPSQYQLDRKDYLVLFSFALITIIAWVSYAHFGFQEYAKHRVEKYTWFLLAIPVYYLFLYTRPRMEVVWAGLVFGSFVAFGRAVLEELSMVDEIAWANMQGRANGSMHPIRFGDLSLLMGCIALNGAINLTKLKLYVRIIGLTAFMAGIGGSVMSESRGGWVALPVLLVIIIWSRLRQNDGRRRFIVVFSVVLLSMILAFMINESVRERVSKAVKEISIYVEKGENKTSIGVRFDMFRTALSAFSENPVFGVGVGGYNLYSKQFSKRFNRLYKKGLSWEVTHWKNPHNEFLLHASTRGVLGLFSLIFMMFAIVRRGFIVGHERGDKVISFSSVNLVIIAVGFSIFGLTIALFEHKDFLLFFLIYVPISLSGVLRDVRW